MQAGVEILKKLRLFNSLGTDELAKINAITEEAFFSAGEHIVDESKACDSLYIIKKGSVKVTKRGTLLVVLGEGSTLGELSFIDKGLPSATVTAQEDCTLIKIPTDAFQQLIARDREIYCHVNRSFALMLCQKLRDTNEWLTEREWLSEIGKDVDAHPQL